MLRSINLLSSTNLLSGYTIAATDGDIGHVYDFYFDDESWTICYLVVDTGNWLPGRKVLIAPEALGQPDWQSGKFPVMLSKDRIKNSPDIDATGPVSRQQEAELHHFYEWQPYWTPVGLMTPEYPFTTRGRTDIPSKLEEELEMVDQQAYESSLRSTKEVKGYHIQASDGEIGHVEDFIADDATWIIRYMVVDTRNWLPGKKVLISPQWVDEIEWGQAKVYVELSQEQIKNGPEYDPAAPVNREYETRLYDFYGRPTYWSKKEREKEVV